MDKQIDLSNPSCPFLLYLCPRAPTNCCLTHYWIKERIFTTLTVSGCPHLRPGSPFHPLCCWNTRAAPLKSQMWITYTDHLFCIRGKMNFYLLEFSNIYESNHCGDIFFVFLLLPQRFVSIHLNLVLGHADMNSNSSMWSYINSTFGHFNLHNTKLTSRPCVLPKAVFTFISWNYWRHCLLFPGLNFHQRPWNKYCTLSRFRHYFFNPTEYFWGFKSLSFTSSKIIMR